MKTILALDQGTTNTKALLLDPHGEVIAQASQPLHLDHPRPGWAEQSADQIWLSIVAAIAGVLDAVPESRPEALAVSNQRETILLWNAETGNAIGPAISWQCLRST